MFFSQLRRKAKFTFSTPPPLSLLENNSQAAVSYQVIVNSLVEADLAATVINTG